MVETKGPERVSKGARFSFRGFLSDGPAGAPVLRSFRVRLVHVGLSSLWEWRLRLPRIPRLQGSVGPPCQVFPEVLYRGGAVILKRVEGLPHGVGHVFHGPGTGGHLRKLKL